MSRRGQRTPTRRPPAGRRRGLMAVLLTLLVAAPASATQHLVNPGDDWSHLAKNARPGDVILLLPGVHRPITLEGLAGRSDEPITIRSLDPAKPAVFQQDHEALTLISPRHVVLENIIFDRCRRSAIIAATHNRHAVGFKPGESRHAEAPGHLVLRDITITRTGPGDKARAVVIDGLTNVSVESCTFEGWTGRALEIIGGRLGVIKGCTFTGIEQYDAELAVAVHGGAANVTISGCTFENTGETTAVSLGGDTPPERLVHRNSRTANDKPVFEATHCRVIDCTFIDQPCPIVLAHANRCEVRHCTIVRPTRWVFALLTLHDDPRVGPTSRPIFSGNLISWNGGDLAGLFLLDAGSRSVTIVLESNLWWSDDDPAMRRRMIPSIVEETWPQEVAIDPKLDDAHQPTSDDASIFGVRSGSVAAAGR